MWDDTVAFTNGAKPPQWAEENIGRYLQKTFEVTGTCVVDPGDRIIYHSSAVTAAEHKPDSWHLLGGGAKAFFDKAQATTMAESIPVMT